MGRKLVVVGTISSTLSTGSHSLSSLGAVPIRQVRSMGRFGPLDDRRDGRLGLVE